MCQAIQHGHQKDIVHPELEPANILITLIDGKPVPKVIDFGLAKATGDQRRAAGSLNAWPLESVNSGK
jgi:serine/threonine protein kinase